MWNYLLCPARILESGPR